MKHDAIIVGAGISGLLISLAMAKEGKKILILEKGAYIGGNARSYEHKGYKLDIGPHAITSMVHDGPLPRLMEKYFDLEPKFIPHGDYFVRSGGRIIKFPWSIKEWMLFEALPAKDRLALVQAITKSIAMSVAESRSINLSVADFLKDVELTDQTRKFIDGICYFLSGKDSRETPAGRILKGSGYVTEEKQGLLENFSRVKKLARHNGSHAQFYPRSGIISIIKAIEFSFPVNMVDLRLKEKVNEIIVENGKAKGVKTQKGDYYSDLIIYSGYAKSLPDMIDQGLPEDYTHKLRGIKQSKALTIWLGLKEKSRYFDYLGSEIGFEKGKPYWAMPTSNYDRYLAPEGKQLIAFAFMLDGDTKEGKKHAMETIYDNFPEIKDQVEMIHYQVVIPEKAAATVDNFFPSPKTPLPGLWIVGTDANPNSMGITRAAYSVIDCLNLMRKESVI